MTIMLSVNPMMMSCRSTVVMFVLALLSAGAALWAWRTDESARSAPRQDARLFAQGTLPVDEVSRITLERRDRPAMVFERGPDGAWKQVAPFEHPVETFSMREFVVQAASLESAMRVPASELTGEHAPNRLELDPPLASLRLEWSGGSREILIGRRMLGGRSYVRMGRDGDAHLVAGPLPDRATTAEPWTWRSRRLFRHAGVETRVAALTGVEAWGMIREGRGWKLEKPLPARLDPQKVEEFLGLLADAQASEFIVDQPPDLTPFGLAQPALEFTVISRVRDAASSAPRSREVEESILIGAARDPQGSSYFAMVKGRPVVIAMPRAMIDRLRAVGLLLDLRAVGVDAADVKSIRITAEAEFTIARDDADPAKWVAPDRGGRVVPADAAQRLLDHLTTAQAVDCRSDPYPFAQEKAQLLLFGFDGQPIVGVRLAKLEDGRWAMFSDDSLVRYYPGSMDLPLSPGAFGLE
ncbi:MAG: DUF4340 domain-containing protein [Phycisphaeraceae bacterium]|nr:MAG: DUF4340 domain-containing protein [Phycisphaeraceae bacterium]